MTCDIRKHHLTINLGACAALAAPPTQLIKNTALKDASSLTTGI